MTEDKQDRLRDCLALLHALATDDSEGADAITNATDLNRLARDTGQLALVFIEHINDDPVEHIRKMFRAADLSR